MAAAPWYRAGTVNVANGSTAVVGVQTAWKTSAAPLNAGDVFLGPDGKLYEVESITTDTALALKTPYQGAAANGAAYAVVHNFSNTLPADLYAKLAETLQQYHLSWDEFCTWATATGDVTFTNIAGGVITLPGLVALTNALNGRTVKNITGGVTVTLTTAEAQARLLDVTGSGNNTLKVPAQSGMWVVSNLGSGTLTVLTAAANSTGITLAAGKRRVVMSDAANIAYAESRGTMSDQDANNVNIVGGSAVNLTSLGIGTSTPSAKLHIETSTTTQAVIKTTSVGVGDIADLQVTSNDITLRATAYGSTHGARPNQLWLNSPSAQAALILATANTERVRIASSGNVGINAGSFGYETLGRTVLAINGTSSGFVELQTGGVNRGYLGASANNIEIGANGGFVSAVTGGLERFRVDPSGNFLVGVSSGASHRIVRGYGANDPLLNVSGNESGSTQFFSGSPGEFGFNGAASCQHVWRNATTGRSLNAAGTINASGADYAEYEKNNGLSIPKGALVGFKTDGTLTLSHADAVRFGIKSTDPSYVGGDTWGSAASVGQRPEAPIFDQPTYQGVSKPDQPEQRFANPYDAQTQPDQHAQAQAEAEQAHQAALAAYESTLAAWMQDQAAYQVALQAAQADHDSAMAVYQAELAAFEGRLEAARLLVDRVAYSGKVPVNVQGCTPGGYVLAAAGPDGAIVGEFVADPDFAQYKRAVGRVNRILPDGRAEVAVIVH
ncbi:hypothetical protein [Chitinimonas taiwanensis]|uniref:hypothetical protein n=1 Tax=Chitinimonas taiwanensis TaxID=240412 RepID=UPI0035B4DC69